MELWRGSPINELASQIEYVALLLSVLFSWFFFKTICLITVSIVPFSDIIKLGLFDIIEEGY